MIRRERLHVIAQRNLPQYRRLGGDGEAIEPEEGAIAQHLARGLPGIQFGPNAGLRLLSVLAQLPVDVGEARRAWLWMLAAPLKSALWPILTMAVTGAPAAF